MKKAAAGRGARRREEKNPKKQSAENQEKIFRPGAMQVRPQRTRERIVPCLTQLVSL